MKTWSNQITAHNAGWRSVPLRGSRIGPACVSSIVRLHMRTEVQYELSSLLESVEEDFGGVKVNVCRAGCHGIWFDWGELAKLDKQNEGLGQSASGSTPISQSQRYISRSN